ncbi:MAG: radical SAM protein [Calditrichaeota bacterium]|nr:MAG: radical SAM protein [Calditrichota bacterium]
MITARGCAFTCKWCSHSVYGYTHRRRRPEKVLEEIQEIIKAYHPTHLWFADDVFTVNKRWLQKFHALMKEANIHLPFECIARADKLDEEIVVLLKELGCYRVWFGAESGSQKILDAMSRGVTLQQITDATRWCQKHQIQAGFFVMFGYPDEELEDIYQTIEFVKTQQPDVYLTTVAYPLRGTRMFEEVQDRIITEHPWEEQFQRTLELRDRYTPQLYQYAIKKLASEYRHIQLKREKKELFKQLYHSLRSRYCDWRIHQLARLRT